MAEAHRLSTKRMILLPRSLTKTVHFIRHGEAFSNVAGHADHAQYMSEAWFDASLSPQGWQQAEALGQHVRAIALKPELVVVSPLTRALQTASAAFGAGHATSEDGEPSLMVEYPAIHGSQHAHAAIASKGAPPFVCMELCREHLGVHPCDRRRPTAHYKAHFPAVDFSLVTDETDQLWHPNERESRADIAARGAQFLAWLMSRPESHIAVVSHSSFLHFTLTNFTGQMHNLPPSVASEYMRWFENCELRTLVLADPHMAAPAPCTTHFPGGHKALSY